MFLGEPRAMGDLPPSIIDESRYRTEVLLLPDGATLEDAERDLLHEAHDLGLSLPAIELAASVASSTATRELDLSSTRYLPPSSVGRTRSVSETTLSSTKIDCASLPSVASSLTQPASCNSNGDRLGDRSPRVRNDDFPRTERDTRCKSTASITLPASRKRSSLISAISKFSFRKPKPPWTSFLPPEAQITIKSRDGQVDRILVETRLENNNITVPTEDGMMLKMEVPIYDEPALQRSLGSPELRRASEGHRAELSRHIALRKELLQRLKTKHRADMESRQLANEQEEKAKREQNIGDAARLEERHLAAEMDQRKEFEREKRNSQTRIKYMERYCNTPGPPSPRPEISSPSHSAHPVGPRPTRRITPQQKQQLAQEYLDQCSMDQLHGAKIKVLRDLQERQLQETISRMEKELQNLINRNVAAAADLEKEHCREGQCLLDAFKAKEAELIRRWNLEEAIIRKKLELRDGQRYGPLPPLSQADLDMDIDRDS